MGRTMKDEACIVSGTKNYVPYSEGLIKNIDSDLIVAEYIPDEAELERLYEEDYFFGQEYFDYLADRPALEKNFAKRIKALKKAGALGKDKTLVEVGCAYGYFMNMVKDQVGSVSGYDVAPDGIKYAKEEFGLSASTDNFLTEDFPEKVDVVAMWDVIEHVSEPDAFVKKSAEILKKGGVLTLTTGDIGTLLPRMRGGKWRMIHPPTHIYYFNKKSMTALLDKLGFDIVDYHYDAQYRNVGSALNQLIMKSKAANRGEGIWGPVLSASKRIGLDKLNIPLNLRDIMNVTAVKR